MAAETQIRAIEALAAVVRDQTKRGNKHKTGVEAAVKAVADVARSHGAEAVGRALTEARGALIQPLDPSTLDWDVFRLFEHEDSETHWTKWLASTFKPEHGEALSHVTWRALCGAVIRQSQEPTVRVPEEGGVLAVLDDWRTAKAHPPARGEVDREVHDDEFGRTDIIIATSSLYVLLENKLEEGWHDTDEPQAVRYRRFALKHRAGRKLALVLLTNRDDFKLVDDYADYVRIDYRSLARSLRDELKAELQRDPSIASAFALWPALMTVAAIEHNLLHIDMTRYLMPNAVVSWQSLGPVTEIVRYLRED